MRSEHSVVTKTGLLRSSPVSFIWTIRANAYWLSSTVIER